MTTFRGTWTATVEQDFEIEADSREEAEQLLSQEMNPRNVVELNNFSATWEDE